MGSSLMDPIRALRNRSPVPYATTGSRGGGFAGLMARPSGQEAQMRAQGTNGTLFAIVDRIITSYSQVEWHLYRKAPSGLKEDRKEVTSHAILDLWNKPNGFMVGPVFREAAQQHEELTGEQWWVIARVEGSTLPLELWPVRPDRMRPVADPEEFIVGYEYIGPSGEVIPLAREDVIFLRRPNPLDVYRGLGPVQTILTDLDASRYSREWNRNFFLNSAEPGGILQVAKRLGDEEFNEHRERWAEQHKGVGAAHRVALLENGITWVDRKYTNRDMQFAELANVSDEKIRTAFGFPKPMLGAVDDVNRANADAAEVVLARWLTVPRLRRVKAVLNYQILPMYGRGVTNLEMDFDNPVPEDVEAEAALLTARSAAAAALVNAGFQAKGTLFAVGLPDIPFEGPRKPPVVAEPEPTFADVTRGLFANAAATTWTVRAHVDLDICQPCKDNDGHKYDSQAAAYADYPGGKGYVKCLGKSNCRCTVVEEN
ncbi:phage portal protein [Actinacidiphila sp. ITFR-21]|uniref:phage portal protein n=1 Tax=Actinacidiphila sp. ITFR-21 TaxID=3075199 RepID=UPI00288C0B90|nr:phage portal protein [Streptomyces sp. ITFR-21]WNI19163.1 phage portal protein [Streptomyces sp. ITFR-21]